LKWIEATKTSKLYTLGPYIFGTPKEGERGFICNGDETYRVQTGVVGFRIASTWGGYYAYNKVKSAINKGSRGDEFSCPGFTNATRSHPYAVLAGYTGADARGFVFASSQDIIVDHNFAKDVRSYVGTVIVFDVMTDSTNVYMNRNEVRSSAAGLEYFTFTAPIYYYRTTYPGPTPFPVTVGFHVDQRAVNVIMDPFCVNSLATFKDKQGFIFKTAMPNNTLNSQQFNPLATPKQMIPVEWKGCHSRNEPWWIWLIVAIVSLIFIVALLAVLVALMDGGSGGGDTYQEMK